MGLGDELMAAGEAERLFRADPSRPVAILDNRGDVRWHPLWDGNPAIATPGYVHSGRPYQAVTNGVKCRPYIRYPFTAERGMTFTTWRATDHVARLYLTPEELAHGTRLRAEIGPYLLIEPDVKPLSTPNKKWGLDRYAELVAALPDVTFVRAHGDEAEPFPSVRNIRTRTFRDACGLLAASDGYVGNEGGLHHAAAALCKPAVVIFGGFISPQTTGYATHTNIADRGPLSPCGKWLPCEHCAAAMGKITVAQVADAVRQMRVELERAV
jgi:ADP-heptose:LPS heptosyltransferase